MTSLVGIVNESSVERLEQKMLEVERQIEKLRASERRFPKEGHDAYHERHARWNREWTARWEKRRAIAKRLGELTPLSASEVLTEAVDVLRSEAESREWRALAHSGGDPQGVRESIALATLADALESTGPLTFQRFITEALEERKAVRP